MTTLTKDDLTPIPFQHANEMGFLFDALNTDIESYIDNILLGDLDHKEDLKRYYLQKLEEKWLPLVGFSARDLLDKIREIQSPELEFQNSYTLKELITGYEQTHGTKWLVPHLLRSTGLYLLGGEAKTGKSLLAYFLMYGVCVSGEFLGRPVRKGKVLYIQLEESVDTVQERLYLTGFGRKDESTSLAVNFEHSLDLHREFNIAHDLSWLTNKILKDNYDLVVIDNLRASTQGLDISENSAEFGKLVQGLQSVFTRTGKCGILIHHMNKGSNRKATLIEKIAGSGAIPAATDGIIGLSSEETNTGRVLTLKTLPRHGTSLTVQYQMINDKGLWSLSKIYEDTVADHPVTSMVLRQLAKIPGKRFTFIQLAKSLDIPYDSVDLKRSLAYLQQSQVIGFEHKNDGLSYWIAEENLWMISDRSFDMFDEAVINANKLLLCKDKFDLRTLLTDWDSETQSKAFRALLPEEVTNLKELINSYSFKEGDKCIYQDKRYVVVRLASPKANFNHTLYDIELIQNPTIKLTVNELDLYPYIETVYEDEPEEKVNVDITREIEIAINDTVIYEGNEYTVLDYNLDVGSDQYTYTLIDKSSPATESFEVPESEIAYSSNTPIELETVENSFDDI